MKFILRPRFFPLFRPDDDAAGGDGDGVTILGAATAKVRVAGVDGAGASKNAAALADPFPSKAIGVRPATGDARTIRLFRAV